MAKVQHIKKARASKKPRRCVTCQHEIQVGESYKKVAKRTGRGGYTLNFCADHHPRPSHLLSGRSAELAEVVESAEGWLERVERGEEELAVALDSIKEDIGNFAADIRESAENMEEGFGHSTAQTEAMSGTADTLEEWAERFGELDEESDDIESVIEEARELIAEEPTLELTG